MNWYLAKIVFRIVTGNGNHKPQFDEQLRLLEAPDVNTAMVKAKALGLKEQVTFFNAEDKMVNWRFINVSEVTCLGSNLSDGKELHCYIAEPENADNYIRMVNDMAARIAV